MRRKVSQRTFIEGLKRVHWYDIRTAWKLLPSMLLAPLYRLKHPNIWLICEDANEARDNGYWFFKYVCERHPDQDCVYAIKKASPDFDKVSQIGKTVEYGSFKHWVLYLASRVKISSQKAGNPNAALFYLLEVYGLLNNKRVFLQHGITINDAKWLYYDSTRMTRFICGSATEYEYIRQSFGYPQDNLVYTGFCRFDNLHQKKPESRQILIMPSWREWIADEDWRLLEYEGTTCIPETNYFKKWTEFLTDSRLKSMAKEYDMSFVFYPHRNMQKYMELFPETREDLRILSANDADVQELLVKSSLLITDYSSVFFDFVYMKKPVVFYQFDLEQFRANQYSEGWFNYQNNNYGRSYQSLDDVMSNIEQLIKSGFEISESFITEHSKDFPLYDKSNCKRVYEIVKAV